ncbi:putative F-box protein [Dichanthelium oligosanthes]|uniref:Putative F-box protein n=1 Tax=Dichanthelium oligosanthes TaxID=888268 RepID=A0A1E5UIU4_9POAL|nr:putative F-box protein [Dichanthelium oligosanthes]
MTTSSSTTVEDLPADVLACALRRLDGRSLAAASCATAGLRALAADQDTWRALCLARWPSLLQARPDLLSSTVSPQRLFADAFPFPCCVPPADNATAPPAHARAPEADQQQQRLPADLVSAVDVYHGGAPLLSRVVETPTSSSWFLTSPFCVDAVECKSPAPIGRAVSPGELELSWVVVDPSRGGRAVNVSSRRPVAVDRHWYTGESLVRYAVVLGGCKFEATVTCSEETGSVREISLAVEDADGATVSGEGALRLLAAAMAGPRKGGEEQEEVAKRRYEEFVRSKRGRKESKARKEVLVDLCCSAVSAVAVLCFIAAVVLR